MLFTDSVFVGIDLNRKSFSYAALDKDLHLLALADGGMEDVTSFLAGQSSVIAAVNLPAGGNRGLVRGKMKKEMLTPLQTHDAELRVADHELRQRGIGGAKSAPSEARLQAGVELYHRLEKMGFVKFPDVESHYQVLETHSHAGYCVLAGEVPLAKSSIEGRVQRQLILYEQGLRVKDPMDFFEEITRHKMIKGIWPMELLYQPEQLDALVAAYTAWLAIERPGKTISLGDTREGQIVLPAAELKEKY
jgi:hypothetical protein